MRYCGGKARISKELFEIINAYRKKNQLYVEPFIGGCNMIEKFDNPRLGADINEYVVAMWQQSQNGWHGVNISEQMYSEIKNNKKLFDKHIVGFAGIACSFGGKWFGGFARDNSNKSYSEIGMRNLERQGKLLIGADIVCSDYINLEVPPNSIIYCDPPYRKTTNGYNKKKFDSDEFFNWCRKMASLGHKVFISEYEAPNDFKCIFEKIINKNMDARKISLVKTEKLYLLEK